MNDANSTTAAPLIVPQIVIRKKTSPQRAVPKKKRLLLKVKTYIHPWSQREELSDAYELPVSQREQWWRSEIKVTPVPGAYESTNFLQELHRKPNSYNFKSETRKKAKDFMRAGLYLLPGGYESEDFIAKMFQKPATYRFKAGERFAGDILNFGLKDKDINVPPNAYSTQNYLAIGSEPIPEKINTIRTQSASKRIPSSIFRLKNGPAPGQYNVKDIVSTTPAITSCFKSKIPRFPKTKIKTPEPGGSWGTLQKLMPAAITGHTRSLFFTPGSEAK